MRDLLRNKRRIWYAIYKGSKPVYELDEDGQPKTDEYSGEKIETGEYTEEYYPPVPFMANVSPGRGRASAETFGTDVNFDLVIATTDRDIPINENSLVWIDNCPKFDEKGEIDRVSADYRVTARPVRSINSALIAIGRNRRTDKFYEKPNN